MPFIKRKKILLLSLLGLHAASLLPAFLILTLFIGNTEGGISIVAGIISYGCIAVVGGFSLLWFISSSTELEESGPIYWVHAIMALIYPALIFLSVYDYVYYGRIDVAPLDSIEHLKQSPELWEEYVYFSLEPEEFVASINPDSNMNTNFHVYSPPPKGSAKGTSYYLDYFFVPFEERASTARIWLMYKEKSTRDSLGRVRRVNSEKFVRKFSDLLESKEALFFMRSNIEAKAIFSVGESNHKAFAEALQSGGIGFASDKPLEKFLLLEPIESPQAQAGQAEQNLLWLILGFTIAYILAWAFSVKRKEF